MIDLHSHTNQSDGTLSPGELIAEARRVGIRTLAITDHDTLSGYDLAAPVAHVDGVNLICGIELSTKFHEHSVHLLGYFPHPDRLAELRSWLQDVQASRRQRNVQLVARLNSLGVNLTLEEVQAQGRSMTGRPHFARVMMQKGYVASIQQAFDEYLTEGGKAYVERHEPAFAESIGRIHQAGGIGSMAHPVRMNGDIATVMPELRAAGLDALEAYHSDHTPRDTERFLALATQYGMAVTGGSDFHGANKPGIALGTGRDGNVSVPAGVLEQFRV